MYGVHKVLVGVDYVSAEDGSDAPMLPPPTVEAIKLGLRIGERANVEITYLTVVDESAAATHLESEIARAQAVVEQLRADAAERGVTAASRVATGRAWVETIREAVSGGHDLVVVGSRNHRTRELLLGTTGTKLLRKCPCPVWVARPGSLSDPPMVIVADDLTDVGSHAVQFGVSAAQLMDARLLLVHAVQYPLEASLRRTECPPDEIKAYRREQSEAARLGLNQHLAQTDHRTLNHGVRIEVTHGPPDVVILDAIEEHQADLLVMGTIARSGIPGLLVGNTAERLLPQVECSILAVKPEDFESPVRLE